MTKNQKPVGQKKRRVMKPTPWPWMGMIGVALVFGSWVLQNTTLLNEQSQQAFLARADELVRYQEFRAESWNQVYLISKHGSAGSGTLTAMAAHFAYAANLLGTAYNGARNDRSRAAVLIDNAETKGIESWNLLLAGEFDQVVTRYTDLNSTLNSTQLTSELNLMADDSWGESQSGIEKYTDYYLASYSLGGLLGAIQFILNFRRKREELLASVQETVVEGA